MVKSKRRRRWAGNRAQIREKRNAYRILVRNSERGDCQEGQGIGGWMLLRWILRFRMGWYIQEQYGSV
jgi:hypothetical protein